MNFMFRVLLAAIAFGAAFFTGAQDYPTQPVRIVVAYPPGGENDLIARLVAQNLAERLNRPFIVDNRPGAGGIVGAAHVASAPADGYTLLLGNTALLSIQGVLSPKLPYQPLDLVPITIAATIPTVLVVHPSLQVNDVAGLVALARAKPGGLNYATPGAGTSMHLTAELFAAQTGTSIVHVPYKGAAPGVAALLANEVQLMFQNVPTVLPHIRSGKLKAIATSSPARLPILPELPTLVEAGIQAESVSWFVIAAPKGTPRPIVTWLNAEMRKALADTQVRKRLEDLGADPVGSTPEEAAALIRRETTKWDGVIKAAGIKADS